MKFKLKRTLLITFQLILAGASACAIGLAAAYLYLSPNLPSVESIRDVKLQTPLRIYSLDGKLIGEFGEKRRTPVKLEDVPQGFIDALLAAEDADFYSHSGVSLRGLARAVSELITTGKRGSGGSTLTMQLTRNVFLTRDKNFARKFNEILLSLKLERELTKNEILELYVNYMFLGKRAYGIQAAAQVYYGKDLQNLSLAQLAMIAGLFQGPSTQNPIINPVRAVERRNWILGRMLSLGLIDKQQHRTATTEKVSARYHGSALDASAPYAAELARDKAIRSFGLDAYTEGYRVYTTIDSRMQTAAQNAVVDGLVAYDQRHGYRGPEQQIEIAVSDPDQGLSDEQVKELSEQLASIPSYGNQIPAIVTRVSEREIGILFEDKSQSSVGWEDGLRQARPYISENARGPAPKTAGDVAEVGDLIRVYQKDERWHFGQLPEAQAALVALDPNNGAIRSIVGGFDFYQSHFNRATQAYRQPGSNFKPFIYTAALENGLTAASLINDAPIVFEDQALEATWRPENDSGRFYGPTRVRKALYLSRNLVSIRVLQKIGIGTTISSLGRFGFDTQALPRDLSLALGTHAVTPIDLATAWASFANSGYKVDAHLIQQVKDFDGNIIYEALPRTVCQNCDDVIAPPEEDLPYNDEYTEFDDLAFELPIDFKRMLGLLQPDDYPRAPKIIRDQVAFIMDSMLKDVILKGTGRKARELQRSDLAGKTGTTNGPNDAWFSGYNGDLVTTTWVGFDQNLPLGNREYGGSAALPIWMDFMRVGLAGKSETRRTQPPGVVTVKIDPESGERARIDDPDAIFEYFRVEQVPELRQETQDETLRPSEVLSEEIF